MKEIIYKIAVRIITKRVKEKHGITPMTKEHLKAIGFIEVWDDKTSKHYWVEKDIKDRDKIWVEFGQSWYRVFHGPNKTFVALESSMEWFYMYHLLIIN